jgi:tetraacyldisaccharide 4'-kinase
MGCSSTPEHRLVSLQSWFNQIWYERAMPPWWLLPLSRVYGGVSALRRYAYAQHLRESTQLPVPVIVVGNLSAGGTGKTPLVCWLAQQLSAQGHAPGIVTRGYGGSARAARLVQATDDPAEVGDEALLLLRRASVPVAVGRDRPAAASLLIGSGCNVIISDDGLQHYALRRDCEIVVMDGVRRWGNGQLLPAGPLREAPQRLADVDALVINGGVLQSNALTMNGAALAGGHPVTRGTAATSAPVLRRAALHMQLEATSALALSGGDSVPLSSFAGKAVHAVAGIGHPQRFFSMLREFGIEVAEHPLPDHAKLRARDISFADDRPVLMTEKDAVKCANFAASGHWYVPVSAKFDSGDSAALLGMAIDAIGRRASRA